VPNDIDPEEPDGHEGAPVVALPNSAPAPGARTSPPRKQPRKQPAKKAKPKASKPPSAPPSTS
jgi:ABC-2 type transport system ATP-binding protein